jgi:putative transposase
MGPVPRSRPATFWTDLGDRATEIAFLVRGRGGQAASFGSVLADVVDVVKVPPRCPRAICFAGRFVLTARTELTDRMLIFGERSLNRRRETAPALTGPD